MARPERHDADYFPFYAKDGRTLNILEHKYGCKGTGFFTNVMRFLTLQPDHHFCIADESDRLYFFSKCKCDEESGMEMLNIMSKTCKIHSDLWVSYMVIASNDLLKSLEDAYRNRKNRIITVQDIVLTYSKKPQEPVVSDAGNPQEPVVSDVNKPQRKLKETKLNIYDRFLSKIDPEQKSSTRAKENIEYWLKHFTEDELLSAIDNYSTIALKRERQFRKDPANFFQKILGPTDERKPFLPPCSALSRCNPLQKIKEFYSKTPKHSTILHLR